jgi:hypothetical protein
LHLLSGVLFIPHQINCGGLGTDKGNPDGITHLGKGGVFGQETKAGVNRLGPGSNGGGQDVFHIEVGVLRAGPPHTHRFISKLNVKAVAVSGRINRHRFDSLFPQGTDNADRNFPPVSY